MNKKIVNLVILVVLLAGVIIAYFAFFSNPKDSSITDDETRFAVKDTAAIQKISLTKMVRDEVREEIVLERKQGIWRVNDSYLADQPQVDNLLTTLSRLTVQAVLTEEGKKNTLTRLRTNHTQVIVSGAEGEMKKFKIGSTNKDQTGNIMLLEGAKNPAVISREGLLGYVSIYFTTTLNRWRDKTLFSERPENLARISVNYQGDPGHSFSLSRDENQGGWNLQEGVQPDSARVVNYLQKFLRPVDFESFAYETYPQMPDSLRAYPPDVQLQLRNQLGLETTVSLYDRGEIANNYFGYLEGRDELLTIQKFVIDSFLVPVDYFVPGPL